MDRSKQSGGGIPMPLLLGIATAIVLLGTSLLGSHLPRDTATPQASTAPAAQTVATQAAAPAPAPATAPAAAPAPPAT